MATSEAIKTRDELQRVRDVLKNSRDRALFTMGVNVAFRGGDLLALNIKDVCSLIQGADLVRQEDKTDKKRRVTLNASCVEVLQTLVAERRAAGASDDQALFVSQRGKDAGTRLTICSLSRMWKAWCKDAGLEGNFASHSARKTFGYLQRTERKVPIEVLQKAFNHSSPATTLAYIGIQAEELKDLYSAEF